MPPKNRRGAGSRRIAPRFPWDPDLPANAKRIQANFDRLSTVVVDAALAGTRPTSDLVRQWHRDSLRGVRLAEPAVSGNYRGQGPKSGKLSTYNNRVGVGFGAPADDVERRVSELFAQLDTHIDDLDARLDNGETLPDVYDEVVTTAAWLHGEWDRIHPFADHNGSTARLLTVAFGLRYGIHFKLPGKPRTAMPSPGLVVDYELASLSHMLGNDENMVVLLHQLAK